MKESLAIPSTMYAVPSNMDAVPSKIDAVPASPELQAQIEAMVLSTVKKKKPWVSLDFEMIEDCFVDGYSTEENGILVSAQWLHDFARAIEAKLRAVNGFSCEATEKNGGAA